MTIVLTQFATSIIISIFVTSPSTMKISRPAHPSPLRKNGIPVMAHLTAGTATARLELRERLSGRRHEPTDAM